MKNSNITKNRTRVTLLLVLAASIIGLASAFSSSARAGSGSYSVNDVSGIYVDLGNGYFKHAGDTPFTIAGFVTFTPATGTFHFDELVRWDQVTYPYVFDGTYTVDPNGHGTMTWLDGIKHRDFYIVNGGAELKWMNTDPNGTGVATSGGTHDQTITK